MRIDNQRRHATTFVSTLLLSIAALLHGPAMAAVPCSVVQDSTTQFKVLVVGDSWAAPTAKALNEEFAITPGLEQVRATTHERAECTTAIGGSAASRWNTAAYKQKISDALAAYPNVTIVHLNLGLNDIPFYGVDLPTDVLRRESAIGFMKATAASRAYLYWLATENLKGVVRHILSVRPNIKVVVAGYDYLNLVDPTSDFKPDAYYGWQASALPATNPWFWQGLSNWMLIDLERNRRTVANVNTSRVAYLYGLGLLQYTKGYKLDDADFSFNDFQYPAGYSPSTADKSIPVGSAALPWNPGYTFLPSPPDMMADRMHLNDAGSRIHAQWAVTWLYKSWLK